MTNAKDSAEPPVTQAWFAAAIEVLEDDSQNPSARVGAVRVFRKLWLEVCSQRSALAPVVEGEVAEIVTRLRQDAAAYRHVGDSDAEHYEQAASLIERLMAIWSDPAALQATLLRTGALSRMNALHIAGATDYDDFKDRALTAERALETAKGALELVAPEEPMAQDEQGGCVWCGGGAIGDDLRDHRNHDADCAWVEARQALAQIKSTTT